MKTLKQLRADATSPEGFATLTVVCAMSVVVALVVGAPIAAAIDLAVTICCWLMYVRERRRYVTIRLRRDDLLDSLRHIERGQK